LAAERDGKEREERRLEKKRRKEEIKRQQDLDNEEEEEFINDETVDIAKMMGFKSFGSKK
jgi:hypothetical protein